MTNDKPNNRIEQYPLGSEQSEVLASANLRKTKEKLQDKTFCFTHCSCDEDEEVKCACNTQCRCDKECKNCYCIGDCICDSYTCSCDKECYCQNQCGCDNYTCICETSPH